jgi:hypothetical protein
MEQKSDSQNFIFSEKFKYSPDADDKREKKGITQDLHI